MKLYCSQHVKLKETVAAKGLAFDTGYVFELFSKRPAFRCFSTNGEADTMGGAKDVYEFDANGSEVIVCEGALEKISKEKFEASAVPMAEYRLGMFIKPVYFLMNELPAENVSLWEAGDDLRLFDGNDKFYIDCLFQKLKEKYPSFGLYAVRSCLEALAKSGRMKRTENEDYVIFEDTATGEIIPVCKRFEN